MKKGRREENFKMCLRVYKISANVARYRDAYFLNWTLKRDSL